MNRLEKNQKWNDTDYDIPKFSYKSAFLITLVTFFVTALTIYFSNGNKICILLALSLSLSLTTAYLLGTGENRQKVSSENRHFQSIKNSQS